mmetsp:Transcript_17044/g.34141  ORF Transcript_17044/g.34141 Transcript_17044/m.34141 type:complete len:109 (-) Transcript_17044:42-368(-)
MSDPNPTSTPVDLSAVLLSVGSVPSARSLAAPLLRPSPDLAAFASAVLPKGRKGAGKCLKCAKKAIVYECMPCGHPVFCKTCAMKMATGGKCKVCGDFFSELRKLRGR